MHRIYQSCETCIVLPGGIRRLVGLEEETTWIHRAWTLQEVLVPKRAVVLFAWQWGSGEWEAYTHCTVQEVIPCESAVSPVAEILHATITALYGGNFSRKEPGRQAIQGAAPSIFRSRVPTTDTAAKAAQCQIVSLFGAMQLQEPDAKVQAIWRSALMRTSSHPVDMVFSIMGLFGVSLDARAFHQDGRLGATIALAKGILRNGGRASWIGVSFYLPPCKQLSSFPDFPETSVEGRAYVKTEDGRHEVAELMNGPYETAWWLAGVPKGSMNDTGYFKVTTKAAPLVLTRIQRDQFREWEDNMSLGDDLERVPVVALNKTVWLAQNELDEADHYAIFIGAQRPFPIRGMPRWHGGWSLRAILVERHSSVKFHRTSCFMLGDVFEAFIDSWKEHTFEIGGPL
ncbi:hypothetical protein AcW1_003301 [Taiwanofungus camphoratus]|nr:hypothetical protein AcV5_001515 [Antrodia cinnamomea]KAI0942756.1 hypothetical protein AcW1_003301 [Antrodia cinnamomea]